jgi:flagellar P-ring protein precursor FlgI
VGLPGTGDSRSGLARASLENFLKNLGMEPETFKSKNVASVLLTATLPSFVRVGDRIDVAVSSIGDAKSLEGGILVQSSLRGADGNVYVAAQGSLEISGGQGKSKAVKTVARITGGGVVERNLAPSVEATIPYSWSSMNGTKGWRAA